MKPQLHINSRLSIPLSELQFEFTRSQGPGGQNVNKLSTRVELLFDIHRSPSLTDAQKQHLIAGLKSRIDINGILHLAAQSSRSQWRNRQDVVERFVSLLQQALAPRKKRIPTKATHGAKQERLIEKKLLSRKKRSRGRISDE